MTQPITVSETARKLLALEQRCRRLAYPDNPPIFVEIADAILAALEEIERLKGARVKPLKWKNSGLQAEYEVAYTGIPDRYVVSRNSMGRIDAQLDYAQRITSALNPTGDDP